MNEGPIVSGNQPGSNGREGGAYQSSIAPPLPRAPQSDPVATIIPYKNPWALSAYYTGVFSLIPCLGLVLGITAFVLGIAGVRYAKSHPGSKGSVHAWIGIILGGGMFLINVVVLVLTLMATFLDAMSSS